jgi:CRP/FNR family cyclic AMP-dependent transcriptional regulator
MSANARIQPNDHVVYLLDHDVGLRRALPEMERARARQHAIATVTELSPGEWNPRGAPAAEAEIGLLVLKGLMIRDVAVAEARCGELIGPGALLRPGDEDGGASDDAPMRHEVGWSVLEPTRLAILDKHFLRVAVHWPTLVTALVARATERTHNLGVMVSIHSLKRVDMRLLAFFWHLADRYGKVTADGVLIPLSLTHRQLALLVGAQRPSVTSALGALAERDLLRRNEHGRWLLASEQPRIAGPVSPSDLAATP